MYGNTKKPRIAKATLRKKNGTGGINLPDFRIYFKVLQNSLVLTQKQTHKSVRQSQEINIYTYGQRNGGKQ